MVVPVGCPLVDRVEGSMTGWLRRGLQRIRAMVCRDPSPYADELPDWGCCALDDAYGSGHQGPCGWKCPMCMGYGYCLDCNGTGGPDDVQVCEWCGGSSQCPEGCVEGWCYEDLGL